MNFSMTPSLLATALALALAGDLPAQATSFTYQGQLTDQGNPATGLYDLHFEVFDAPTGGASLGELATTATEVSNGVFTAILDFGAGVFDGGARWLEIGARANGGDGFETLAPRQPVTPAPFATQAGTVEALGILGTLPPSSIGAGSITSAMLANGSVEQAHLSDSIAVWGRSGDDIHYLNGRVGIGTSSPTQELEILMDGGGESGLSLAVPHVFGDPAKLAASSGRSSLSGSGPQWRDPKYALLSDNAYASLVIAGDRLTSNTLTLDNFGFAIPKEATITGVEVVCEARIIDHGDFSDGNLIARLTKQLGTRSFVGSSPETDLILGSPTDLWSGAPTPEMVNDPSFGVQLECRSGLVVFGEADYRIWLDQVRIIVFFTTPRDGILRYTIGSRPGTANLEFSPGGDVSSPVLTLTRDAKVGIGTGDPSQELEIHLTDGNEAGLTLSVPHTFNDPSSTARPPRKALGDGSGPTWNSPTNSLVSDNLYATTQIVADHGISATLTVSDFGFKVPAGATITGIEVVCEASIQQDNDPTSQGKLQVELSSSNSVKTFAGENSPESDITLGSPTDLWSGLQTPATVNAAGFGVLIRCESGASTFSTAKYQIWLDQVRVHVHYTTSRDGALAYTVASSLGAGDLRLAPGGDVTTPALTLTQEGQVGIGTTTPSETLHVLGNILATGTITPSSDRNLKKNFERVDVREILEQVATLPIQQWSYRSEEDRVRHVGPMAQDFHASFRLGANDVTIATVDADGVALAAIQGLNQKVEEKDAEIAALKARLTRLEQLINRDREGREP